MLVEIKGRKNEERAVTSSVKVAEVFEKEHKNVLRDIEQLKKDVLNFEPMFLEDSYQDSYGRNQKCYLMNRDGFALLAMGFTGEKALKFKADFISAFNSMENELKRIYEERQQWVIEREKGKLVRHILTDTIKMKVSDSPHKKFMYPNYTKLIYKTLFGKSFDDLKKLYGVKPKESVRDYLTSEQLKGVEQMEMLISSLINLGWDYERIKDFAAHNITKRLQ